MTEHMPMPLKYLGNDVFDGSGRMVLSVSAHGLNKWSEVEDIAAFIVTACNNHDKLVETCRDMLDAIDGQEIDESSDIAYAYRDMDVLLTGIAKIGGEK